MGLGNLYLRAGKLSGIFRKQTPWSDRLANSSKIVLASGKGVSRSSSLGRSSKKDVLSTCLAKPATCLAHGQTYLIDLRIEIAPLAQKNVVEPHQEQLAC